MMGLALFSVIRFQRGDLAIAILDTGGFIAATALFLHVFRTHSLRIAGSGLALLSLAGSVALVALGGPEERYLLYPTTVVSFFLMPPAWALSASILAVIAVSLYIVPEIEFFVYGKFLLSISGCFLFAYIFARERNSQRDELLSLSTRDPLTGIGNRRAFDQHLEEALRIQERSPGKVSLLLLDIDNFKAVNDSEGHDAGDRLLRQLAELITERIRAGDHVYRFGGDEFALIAHGAGAPTLAKDLCRRIAALAAREQLPVSASIGLAELGTSESTARWLKNADTALYQAKHSGKNQVSVHSSLSLSHG